MVIMIYTNIRLEIEPHKNWESVRLLHHWFPLLRPAIKALFLKGGPVRAIDQPWLATGIYGGYNLKFPES